MTMAHHTAPSHTDNTALPPPNWAQHSTPEDGGIVHTTLSPLQPAIRQWHGHGSIFEPTMISLSSTDLNIDGTWIRTTPTIQIEGGSYTIDNIRQLRTAIDALLDSAATEINRHLHEAS